MSIRKKALRLSKPELRIALRARRCGLSLTKRREAAEQAARLFSQSSLFLEHDHIAAYLAFQDEIECFPIMEKIIEAHKKCYLPVLSNQKIKSVQFVSYQESDALQLNQYGIREPINKKPVDIERLEVVIVPLVGFDLAGHRLGMGGGYYDRTFELSVPHRPFLLGLGYQCQQVESLPHDPWDILLDGVLTEEELVLFRPPPPHTLS